MKTLPSKQAKELISSGTIVVDVREPHETQKGHLQGAKLMPMSTFTSHYRKIPKTSHVAIICQSGRRSEQVARFLSQQGYQNAINLAGGYSQM